MRSALICLLFVGALSHGRALAQTNPTCDAMLSTVRSDYLDAEYQTVVDALSPCLERDEIDPANESEAYRLLALSYLKLDELGAARAVVLQHLSKFPEYEADPVNDLPSYRAMVQLVRDQLGLEQPVVPVETQASGDETMQVDLVPAGPLFGFLVSAMLGVSSYGGERGVNSDSWLGEFGQNAGPLMGARAEYTLSQMFLLGLSYSVAEYPHIITNKEFNEQHEEIAQESSSKWVHMVSAGLRSRFRGTDWLYPYVTTGVVTSYHFVNDSFSAGVGPTLSVGADFFIDPTMVLFFETEALMIFPGRALDLADHYSSFDPLTSISAGARFRIPGLGR